MSDTSVASSKASAFDGNPQRLHPGSGRRKAAPTPKGRVVDEAAVTRVQMLIGQGPYHRDELIEYLHALQDAERCLRAEHLAALADLMRLPMAEVFEVATFYAHFDVVFSDDQVPPELTIRVCDSLACMQHGAQDLAARLKAHYGASVRVQTLPCMGRCHAAPIVEVGHNHLWNATFDGVVSAVERDDTHVFMPGYQSKADYEAEGGYGLLRGCLDGSRTADAVIGALKHAGLRGLGGAGFPTGMKWDFVRKEAGPRLMAVNGDEGEPGTFKDRHYLETRPHQFLEGMLIGAWAAEAQAVYIYIRDEYPAVREILKREIEALQGTGLADHTQIVLRRGAGAYICGEESAMLESIEGKRGLPRQKPPFPTQVGLFGRPTLINNIETLFWVPSILSKGADWFASAGKNGRQGWRSYSVSGHVNQPQVVLAPAGSTIRDLIEACGGMKPGHSFKAYLPGGASGGILPAAKDDIPLDFGTLEEHGCFIGSAAVMVLSDQDKMRDVALNLMQFFKFESCGQCTPCRSGTEKAVALMERQDWDLELLADLSRVMRDASICGLGQAACNPLDSVIKHFGAEV
jgi:formate dehydrogenase